MAGKDFYAVLGVKRDATDKEIRTAYRKLAREFHPDVNPGDRTKEERFKEINAAYEVLKDPEKRKKYDKYGDKWEYADQIEEQQRRAGSHDFFRRAGSAGTGRTGAGGGNFDFEDLDLGGLDDILGGLFRGRGGTRTAPRRLQGENLEHQVEVTLEEAYHGATRTIQLQSPETCSTCGGTGKIAGATCHVCEGLGSLIKTSRLEVKIPPGVDTGSRVRVAGKGHPGMGGGPPGDMILVVSVRPHERFERKGDDLYVEVPVPMLDAVLGGEVEVPTIRGTKLHLKLPQGTQNGQQFRLGGQGMPHLGSDRKGDLYAKVKVVLPTALSARERELFEELKRVRGGAKAGVA